MLYKSTVERRTFELLRDIQSNREFVDLRLVDSTALALQIGHRKSVDLDFFGKIEFEQLDSSSLFEQYQNVQWIKRSENINIIEINGIKVDFVNYRYPWLVNEIVFDEIKMADLKDIAAMKIAAITGRGSKKDFVDLFFLLKKYTLKQILEFYQKKYVDASLYLALKSLAYFEDANSDPPLDMLIVTDWDMVKLSLKEELIDYLKKS